MNYKLTISYDGTHFSGWQRQRNAQRTIQGTIEESLAQIYGHNIEIIGASRTDAGVHAYGQVANFKADEDHSPSDIVKKLNTLLPDSIAIKSCEPVDDRFHSTYAAKSKKYIYRIITTPDPFKRRYSYLIEQPLDLDKMQYAAGLFIGEHDFKSFSTGRTNKSTVRTIHSIDIEQYHTNINLKFHGNGFLYNMIRIITGTLVQIAHSELKPEAIRDMLDEKKRSAAGFTTPPQGLFLDEVLF